jgi:transposase InsO family protein
MAAWLATQGHRVNGKRVQRLMRLLGLAAIYQRPNRSKPAAAHKIYPYLLRGLAIAKLNLLCYSKADFPDASLHRRPLQSTVMNEESTTETRWSWPTDRAVVSASGASCASSPSGR